MTGTQGNVVSRLVPRASLLGAYSPFAVTAPVGDQTQALDSRIKETVQALKPSSAQQVAVEAQGLSSELFDALAAFKIRTSQVAMHLSDEWRTRLFTKLDGLLDVEQWEPDDKVPTIDSFATALRLLLLIKPNRRPSVGATSDGRIILAWFVETARLTVECLTGDKVRWSLSFETEDGREIAAGETSIFLVTERLSAFGPERWFSNG